MPLHLLPALPDPSPALATEPPPIPRPHLVSLPYWSGWCLGITPGRVTADAPRLPPKAIPKPIDPEAFRRKCMYCRRWFTEKPAYLYHPCRIDTFEMILLWDFVHEALPDTKARRKCSPFPRAHSRSFTRTIKRREEKRKAEASTPDLFNRTTVSYERNPQLPLTRAECKDGPRPCPLVSCRAHSAFIVNEENGSVKEAYPHLRIYKDPTGPGLHALEALHGTCSLDVADKIQDDMTGGIESDGIPGLIALMRTALAGQPIGQTEGYTLEQVARNLGISLERVRQIGARALQEVRVALRRAEGARPGVRRS